MSTKTYSFDKVSLIHGETIVAGYADGVVINATPLGDDWTERIGNDGELTRSSSPMGAHWQLEVTLNQSSDTNDQFSAARALDRLTGAGTKPLILNDAGGRTVAASPAAYIKTAPALTFGQESENRVWILICPDFDPHFGGN